MLAEAAEDPADGYPSQRLGQREATAGETRQAAKTHRQHDTLRLE